MQPGFAKKPAREILVGATFVMGILYVPYSIFWPILPPQKFSALPWLLLVVVGLATIGWLLRRRVQTRYQAGTGHRTTDQQREAPWRFPLPEFLARPIKEILTQTILCTGAMFAAVAILVPFMRAEPVGVSPLGPLVYLALIAMCWMGAQWSKRRQSGGGNTGHPPAPRTSFQ